MTEIAGDRAERLLRMLDALTERIRPTLVVTVPSWMSECEVAEIRDGLFTIGVPLVITSGDVPGVTVQSTCGTCGNSGRFLSIDDLKRLKEANGGAA